MPHLFPKAAREAIKFAEKGDENRARCGQLTVLDDSRLSQSVPIGAIGRETGGRVGPGVGVGQVVGGGDLRET